MIVTFEILTYQENPLVELQVSLRPTVCAMFPGSSIAGMGGLYIFFWSKYQFLQRGTLSKIFFF